MTTTEKPASLSERLDAVVSEAGPLQAAHAVVKAVPNPVIDRERTRAALVRTLAAEVEQSGAWPADAAERWLTVERQIDEAQALGAARRGVLEHLGGLADEAHADATEPKLNVLRAELDEVLDEARDLDAALGNVHDADAAIREGLEATTAWSSLGVLVNRMREVLELHRRLIAPKGLGELASTYAHEVPMPNAPEQDQAQADGARPVLLDRAMLRRIATSEGVVYLPTLGELREMQAARFNPPDDGRYDLSPTTDMWDEDLQTYVRRHAQQR